MDKAARRVRPRSDRDPPAQPDRHAFPTRPRPASCSTRRPIIETLDMAVQRDRRAGIPRAPGGEARARAAISASASRRSPSAPATARPAFAARGMAITPGWETVGSRHGPVGLRRGAHRHVAARPGAAHHARADRRRRARRRAGRDQGHPRRHRPHALRLGHVRQPLAGDRRRRDADRGAQAATKLLKIASHCSRPRRRHRAGGRHGHGRAAPTARSRSRRSRAQAYHQTHRFNGEHRARPQRNRHLRSAGHVLQRLPCRRSSRSMSRPAV